MMRDFLKRKFLSILNLFLVCPLGKKQRKERAKETNNTETKPASRLPLLFPLFLFGRTTAV
jgi:hypothetical protein